MPAISTSWQWALSIGAIALLTIGPALLQGTYVNRWEVPAELTAAASRMDEFPEKIGAWEAFEEGEALSENVQRELGLAGHVSRYYRHSESGDVALVLLMVGQPGPLVRHPPDICFANRANTLLDEQLVKVPAARDTGDAASEFRVLSYEPNSKLRSPFYVAYGFTADGTWGAPVSPRIAYGGLPAVYKVQLQLRRPTGDREDVDKLRAFLEQFVTTTQDFIRS